MIEKHLEEDDSATIDLLYDDLALIIANLSNQNSQISLSLFNDVTMVVRDNLSTPITKILFEKTFKSTDLNNQNCLTFFWIYKTAGLASVI